MSDIIHFETITQAIEAFGLPKPKHPLICLIEVDERIANLEFGEATYVFGFYQMSLKANICGAMLYGRNTYDFQEGTVIFTNPGQAMSFKTNEEKSTSGGWTLLFHPDLIRHSGLGRNIDQYSFFLMKTMRPFTCPMMKETA